MEGWRRRTEGLNRRRKHKGIMQNYPLDSTKKHIIEEMENLGFTYIVDDDESAEEIAEEDAARPTNSNQGALIAFLESTCAPDERWLALWRDEKVNDDIQ